MPHHSAQANGASRPNRRYASVKTIAELYGIDEKTVRRWYIDGLVKGYKIGPSLVRLDLDEVEAKLVKVIPAAQGQ